MPHVVVAGKIHEAGIALLKSTPGFTFDLVSEVSTASYAPLMPKADALLIRTQPLPADLIATSNALKIVSRHGVGYDAIDVSALNARKIPLTIVGDVNSRAVAEHTLALMLAVSRRIVAHNDASKTGNWNERNRFDAVELDGKTVLIIGYGRIGRRVGELVKAFGASIIAYDPFVSDGSTVPDLKAALAQADYVSLHMPGAKDAVIDENELSQMKHSAIIINAARGGLVDEAALDRALHARTIYGAGLDVLVEEPPQPDHPLLSNPYCTISPHNAGLTQECAKRMAIAAAQNIIDHFSGKLNRGLVVNAKEIG